MIPLQNLNQLDRGKFVEFLSGVFEHSPWVAEQAFTHRPFESLQSLHSRMSDIVDKSSKEQRRKLICNHPELAGRQAATGELTKESSSEQAGAGLNNCSADELKQLRQLNKQYLEKFGFPFVIAVKQLSRYDILDAIASRLNNKADEEFDTCIRQISNIARYRLNDLILEN